MFICLNTYSILSHLGYMKFESAITSGFVRAELLDKLKLGFVIKSRFLCSLLLFCKDISY